MTEETKQETAEERAVAKQESKPPLRMGERGLALQNLDDLYRFGKYVIASGLAPKDVTRPEYVVVAVQFGAELGLPPMQSLQSIAVVNGRPALWGDAAKALILNTGECTCFKESYRGKPYEDDFTAVCEIGRKGFAELFTYEFSVADAKLAGLWKKTGPWSQHPKRMLRYRARGFCARDAFPDVLKGLYCAEEAQDIPAIEINAHSEPAPDPRDLDSVADQMAEGLRAGYEATAPEPESDDTVDPETGEVLEEREPEPAGAGAQGGQKDYF